MTAGTVVDDREPEHTPQELARLRPLVLQLFLWLTLYLVALAAMRLWLGPRGSHPLAVSIPAALVPMAPMYLAIRAAVMLHRRIDEFQQLVQYRALAFAFIAGILLSTAYGLLESFAGLPPLPWTLIAPLFLILWVYAIWRFGRLYR